MATTVTETELEALNSEQNNTATTSDTEQTYEGKFVGTLVGNATTAKELEAPYRLTLTGDVSGTTQLNASDTNMSVTVNHASSADTADFAGKTNLAARSTLADMANTAEFSYRAGKLSKLFVNITGACVGSGSATDSDTIDINIDNINVAELFVVGALPEEKANTSRIYVDISNRHFWIYNNDTSKWYDCFEQLETELDNHELRIADLEKLDLSNRVTSLETRATANDVTVADFEKRITANTTTLADHESRISANETTKNNHETRITTAESNIDNLETRVTTNETNIKTNTDNISALDTRVTTTEANVTKLDQRVDNIETSTDVGALATKITSIEEKNIEQDTSIKANTDAISTEVSNRSAADTALEGKISDEVTARTNADNALATSVKDDIQPKLNELSAALSDEVTARTNADTLLSQSVQDDIQPKLDNLSKEIANNKDTLNSNISKLSSIVSDNKTNTDNSISDINSRIVDLTSSQDITGHKTFSSGINLNSNTLNAGQIELSASTPYINFYFNESTDNYTSRLIATTSSRLDCEGDFYVTGNIQSTAWCYATTFKSTSDKNLKKNISEVAYDLSTLKTYRYKFKNTKDQSWHVGLLAQEVQFIIPDAVNTNHSEELGDYLTLDYNAVVAALVSEVNILKERISKLENK